MVHAKLILLGFDVRAPIANQSSNWSDARRSKFLIRPEVQWPVSVDSSVWPLFAPSKTASHPYRLWGSVSEVLSAFPEMEKWDTLSPAIVEISVTADEDGSKFWEGIFSGYVTPEDDAAIELAADSLGFDIADRYFLSGLSNCMLSDEELAAIRKDWSQAINEWGLFDTTQDAESFRPVCDHLIPEHAPFEVYRLRRITLVRRQIRP